MKPPGDLNVICSAIRLGYEAKLLHGIFLFSATPSWKINHTYALTFALFEKHPQSLKAPVDIICEHVTTIVKLMEQTNDEIQVRLLLTPGIYPNMLEEMHAALYLLWEQTMAFTWEVPRYDYWQPTISAPETVY
jgi:hypothetical protein